MASRKSLNLLNFDLAFAKCPKPKKDELVKLFRAHYIAQEKLINLKK